jgi:hypothetical protein
LLEPKLHIPALAKSFGSLRLWLHNSEVYIKISRNLANLIIKNQRCNKFFSFFRFPGIIQGRYWTLINGFVECSNRFFKYKFEDVQCCLCWPVYCIMYLLLSSLCKKGMRALEWLVCACATRKLASEERGVAFPPIS